VPKPTMDDVARRAGVSRALVSLALRGSPKVSPRSREAVRRAVAELGYRPNLNARNLASSRTRTLGVIVNDLHNPFFPVVTDGIKSAVDALDYRLLVTSAFLDNENEAAALETFIDLGLDGVIMTGCRLDQSPLDRAARAVPLVIVSRPLDSSLLDTVNNDDVAGARLATQHLIDLGHRHIGHVSGGDAAGAPLRKAGYVGAMRDAGLQPVVTVGAFTEASGVTAGEELFDSYGECTAVFAGNDLSALGVLDVIDGRGRAVPDDVSLVGYDNTFVAALRHVGLTSIDQHGARLGRIAVSMIIERLEHGRTEARHEMISPALVVRETTAPPRA